MNEAERIVKGFAEGFKREIDLILSNTRRRNSEVQSTKSTIEQRYAHNRNTINHMKHNSLNHSSAMMKRRRR